MAADDVRSEAVVLLLGRGLTPYPKRDPQRLIDRFGQDRGLDLLGYAEGVVAELYEVEPDWSVDDLASATAGAVGRVRERHPELSENALDALGWSFNWDWK